MQTIRTLALLSVVPFAAAAMPLGGCDKKSEAPTVKPATSGSGSTTADDEHDHKDGDGHDHDDGDGQEHRDGHDEGAATELGQQTAGAFIIKASRNGAFTPGKDASINVWVTGGTAKVAAVRFWIGTQDGKGSMKAKAELEKENWHNHAEIPSPLPAGSKLWVEVEDDKGAKSVAGFDLKA